MVDCGRDDDKVATNVHAVPKPLRNGAIGTRGSKGRVNRGRDQPPVRCVILVNEHYSIVQICGKQTINKYIK